MKEMQQLRRIAVKLETSGTAIPLAETRLYKGGFGFVVLQAYVPITQNRAQDTSPLCTAYRITTDAFGNRKQFNKDIYNLPYIGDKEIAGEKYMLFERLLPRAFAATVGELEIVFHYSEIADNTVVSRIAGSVYRTTVAEGGVSDGEIVAPPAGELAQLNDLISKFERLEYNVDALLQPPDCSEADRVGTPSVEIDETGKFKFGYLKGKDGANAIIQWGVNGASPMSTVKWKEV